MIVEMARDKLEPKESESNTAVHQIGKRPCVPSLFDTAKQHKKLKLRREGVNKLSDESPVEEEFLMVMQAILRRCVDKGLVQAEEGELMERAWMEIKERYRVYIMDAMHIQEFLVNYLDRPLRH